MYFVDREKIEEILLYMENKIEFIQNNKSWDSQMEKMALERGVHTIIEAILDTGNAMIDGFIMRDPGSYEDIVDILTDEKVVNEELSLVMKEFISFRKILVQHYINVNHEDLINVVSTSINKLKTYPSCVRNYLTNELGPISAFKK